MDTTSQETQVIFSGMQYADELKWSPNGRWLAFTGAFQYRHGIYVFDPDTSELIYIWENKNKFDWSPDSKQMVILGSVCKL
jgi:Tol biopolymer transport system component